VKNRTQTLVVVSAAPAFTLRAANGEGAFSLSNFLSRGPLVIEFLRGTW
jgi:hypothetical protein